MDLQPKFSLTNMQSNPSDFWIFAAVCNWLSAFGPWVGLDVDVLKLEAALLNPTAHYEMLADIHMALLKSMQKKPEVVTQDNWQTRLAKYVKDNWEDMWTVQESPMLSADKQMIIETDYLELHYEYRLGLLHDLCVGVMKYAGPVSESITAIVRAGRSYELRLPALGEYKDLRDEITDSKCQYWLPCTDAPLLFATDYEGDWTPVSRTEDELADFVSLLESSIISERAKRKKLPAARGKVKGKAKAKSKMGAQSAMSAALLKEGDDLLTNLKITMEACSEARIRREEKEQAEIKKRERDSRRIAKLESEASIFRVEAGSRRTRTRVNYALDQDDDFLDDILDSHMSEVTRPSRRAPPKRSSTKDSQSSSVSDSEGEREHARRERREREQAERSERERTSRRGRSTKVVGVGCVPSYKANEDVGGESSAGESISELQGPAEIGSDNEGHNGAKLQQLDTSLSTEWQGNDGNQTKASELRRVDTGGSIGWQPSEHEEEFESDESNSKYTGKVSNKRSNRSVEKPQRKRKRKQEQVQTGSAENVDTEHVKPKHRKLIRLCDAEKEENSKDANEKLDPNYQVEDADKSYSPSSESSETLLDVELMRDEADDPWVDERSDNNSDSSYDFAADLQRERGGVGSSARGDRKGRKTKKNNVSKPAQETSKMTARKSYEEWHSDMSDNNSDGAADSGSVSDLSVSDDDYK
ncbi:hypothetical protein SARC_00345 [Sphaeroforma arctica JP610]|uniref:DDT domain-containing protein n=1 Tax=Sphaeroforma arctica JP610 TaxID=667725 RepID=A0A0L0GF81_9EUKA|nr:hypothetical protein SARC_00345 [Sphaeroforma arctica JP610]KNC87521.1 hypothetical protein SARC_00345 [Sphaeroforma arctica JP610]|eukprot:XP_014161423.1 hypothetical protein SARC_00345 [Sphaeroforma arctica JP610]